MSQHEPKATEFHDHDSAFADIVDDLIERLYGDDVVEIDAVIAEHPQHEEHVRAVWSAINLMAGQKKHHPFQHDELALATHLSTAQKIIGDFRILNLIGRGGMGMVYRAEQISMGREVALKILPFAVLADSKALQRFKNEVRAAATLNHSNIVPVHSIGEERGIHFYAMQLIKGQTLTEVIQDLRRMALGQSALNGSSIARVVSTSIASRYSRSAGISEDCSQGDQETVPKASQTTVPLPADREFFRSVAMLGVQAAEALEHAHQRGVIHRDVKPGNLMLDAEAHLYVTDFGLARIEADAGMTMTGDLMGTLRYMSPEQALAKRVIVDHRTDVYSLGVTLYELLTLEPAVVGKDRHEVLKRIAFSEPRRPRSINGKIPTELETIVLKALAKDPESRYETAGDLANDLQRYLDDQPIVAKPPKLVQVAARWSRRNKPIVTFLAVMLLLSSVGLAISNFLIARQRQAALQERDKADQEKLRADENFHLALDTVDQLLTLISENELMNAPSLQPLRKELLEYALDYYQAFIKNGHNDPSLVVQLGHAYYRVGNINIEIGTPEKAIRAHRKALSIREDLVTKYPRNLDRKHDMARSCMALSEQLIKRSEFEEASKLLETCISISRSITNLGDRNPRYFATLGGAYYVLAGLQLNRGEQEAAEDSFRQSTDNFTLLVETHPESPEYLNRLAGSLSELGRLYALRGEQAESIGTLEEALEIQSILVSERPDVLQFREQLSRIYHGLAQPMIRMGQLKEAIPVMQSAISIQTDLARENPRVHEFQEGLADDLMVLAYLHWTTGSSSDAEAGSRQVIEIREQLVNTHPNQQAHQFQLGLANYNLGFYLCETGKVEEARAPSERAAQLFKEIIDDGCENVVRLQFCAEFWASCPVKELRDIPAAIAVANEAVKLAPNWPEAWRAHGIAHFFGGEYSQAVESLNRFLQMQDHLESLAHVDCHLFLAMTHCRRDERNEGQKHYNKAVALMEEHGYRVPFYEELRRQAAEMLGEQEDDPIIVKASDGRGLPAGIAA